MDIDTDIQIHKVIRYRNNSFFLLDYTSKTMLDDSLYLSCSYAAIILIFSMRALLRNSYMYISECIHHSINVITFICFKSLMDAMFFTSRPYAARYSVNVIRWTQRLLRRDHTLFEQNDVHTLKRYDET